MKLKEDSFEWLAFAQLDLQAAQELVKLDLKFSGIVAYHAQQAAEKSLHAYLIFKENSAPKTHDLSYLIKQCSLFDGDFIVLSHRVQALEPFSVKTRYPDHFRVIITHVHAQELIDYAAKIVEFVSHRMER